MNKWVNINWSIVVLRCKVRTLINRLFFSVCFFCLPILQSRMDNFSSGIYLFVCWMQFPPYDETGHCYIGNNNWKCNTLIKYIWFTVFPSIINVKACRSLIFRINFTWRSDLYFEVSLLLLRNFEKKPTEVSVIIEHWFVLRESAAHFKYGKDCSKISILFLIQRF